MADIRWHFDPPTADELPAGESPFRVRGLAYMAVLEYVNKRLPGGMKVVERLLPDAPTRNYLDQLFVALGEYDVVPLARLFCAAASVEGQSVGHFIEERSRGSARTDSEGIWRALLSSKSVSQMVERLPITFNRYFEPCRATVSKGTGASFTGDLANVPSSMNGIYVFSTQGFVGTCLERSGAKNVQFAWNRPVPTGQLQGMPVETVRFIASWE